MLTDTLALIVTLEREFFSIVALSLRVSLTATLIAFGLGAPIALILAIHQFKGRQGILIVINALQGLPPVVVGLVLYLMLSRSGPLGPFGLLFTPTGMVLAQCILVLPITIALLHRQFEGNWREVGDALRLDGASFLICLRVLVAMNRAAFLTIFLTAFGRAIAEVGAIMIVGGNIRGATRTMTTTIALETSKGDLALALALGLVLISLTMLISGIAMLIGRQKHEV